MPLIHSVLMQPERLLAENEVVAFEGNQRLAGIVRGVP
jgi:hypothetical protein